MATWFFRGARCGVVAPTPRSDRADAATSPRRPHALAATSPPCPCDVAAAPTTPRPQIIITTDLGGKRRLRERRSLEEDGAAVKMAFELTTPAKTITFTRWLVRGSPPAAPAPAAAGEGE